MQAGNRVSSPHILPKGQTRANGDFSLAQPPFEEDINKAPKIEGTGYL